jgi:uncharacterized membrane protein
MHQPGFYELVFIFTVSGFFGWVMEVSFFSIMEKKLINRGFLASPILPVYGFGALIILWLDFILGGDLLLLSISSILVLTALEYATAVLLEGVFHRSWWDYSKEPFNFRGRICLHNSLYWGVLSVAFVKFAYPYLIRLFSAIPFSFAKAASITVVFILFADALFAIVAVLEANKRDTALGNMASSIMEKERRALVLLDAERKKLINDAASLKLEYEKMAKKYLPVFIRNKLKKIPPLIHRDKNNPY